MCVCSLVLEKISALHWPHLIFMFGDTAYETFFPYICGSFLNELHPSHRNSKLWLSMIVMS